jgi:2-keto-myo-inositol isomerase
MGRIFSPLPQIALASGAGLDYSSTPMNAHKLSRRKALAGAGLLAGTAALGVRPGFAANPISSSLQPTTASFRFCLNTATLRGQKLGIAREVEIAAKAGYDAIEPWIESLQAYVQGGGSLKDLGKQIKDSGLTVEDAIGFPQWLVEDEAKRAKGVEQAKREMDLVAQIGGRRLAAPPVGATDLPKLSVTQAAERYRVLLEAGAQIGVVPQLELWGFSKNCGRLSECVAVAMETGQPNACVLIDVFHLYKGGSEIHGISLLGPEAIQMLHMNDYPNDPPREKIDDSYRAYPGDGVAPLPELLQMLRRTGGRKVLSLELFNRKYWTEDPLEVAKTGLAKMKAIAAK